MLQAEAAELNAALRGFDQILAQVARPDTPVELSLSEDTLPVMVDLAQLELALINLVRKRL